MKWKQNNISKTTTFSIIVLSVFLLDQITKIVIRSTLPLQSSLPVIQGFFHLTHVGNTGISFGMLKGNNLVFLVISLVALVYFVYEFFKTKEMPVIYALVVAGILGNGLDRVLIGHVTDFMDFRIWPIFNVADMSISLAVVLILWVEGKKLVKR